MGVGNNAPERKHMKMKILLLAALLGVAAMSANAGVRFGVSIGLPLPIVVSRPVVYAPAPVSTYNPDWAIVKEDENGQNKVYLVRETKGTNVWLKVPEIQRKKIQCGKAHFKAIGFKSGEYAWVDSAGKV
jgi:hypothetical protein